MMSKADIYLITIIKTICILIPFSLLVIATPLLFPYITGKALYVRILIEIAVFLTSILLLQHKELWPTKKDYLFWSSLLLLLSMFLLLIFSVRPYLSFWGNAERMEGVWGILHFFLWFYVLYFLFKVEPSAKKTIFWAFILVSILIGLQEIYEGLVLKTQRPFATLGNPTYIGFLSLLLIFLNFYFLRVFASDKLTKIFLWLLLPFLVVVMVVSGTRGSMIGLLAGVLGSVLYLLFSSKKLLSFKIGFLGFILLGVFGFYLFLKTDIALRLPGANRLATILHSRLAETPRWLSWGIFWNGFKAKPVFGYGLENAPLVYYKHFNPDIFKYEEVIFDRPHNKFLEVAVTQGASGLIVWIIFLAAAFAALAKVTDRYLKASLLGFLTAYVVQSLTLFDMQVSYLFFFFGLSLLSPPVSSINQRSVTSFRLSAFKSNFGYILLLLLLAVGLYLNFYHLSIVKGVIDNLKLPATKAIDNYAKLADRAGPFLQEEAIILKNYIDSHRDQINTMQQIDKITGVFKKAYTRDPVDIRIINIYTSHLSTLIAVKKNNQINYESDQIEGERIFQETIKDYKNFPDVYLNYATFLTAVGKKTEAIQVLDQAKGLARSVRLIFILANIFDAIGETDKALAIIQEARQSGITPSNIPIAMFNLQLYLKTAHLEEAKVVIGEILKMDKSAQTFESVNKTLKDFGYPQLQLAP